MTRTGAAAQDVFGYLDSANLLTFKGVGDYAMRGPGPLGYNGEVMTPSRREVFAAFFAASAAPL